MPLEICQKHPFTSPKIPIETVQKYPPDISKNTPSHLKNNLEIIQEYIWHQACTSADIFDFDIFLLE